MNAVELWFSTWWAAFIAKNPGEQAAEIAATIIPIVVFIYGILAWFSGRWPFQRSRPEFVPSGVRPVALSAGLSVEAEIVGRFHDLSPEAQEALTSTLDRLRKRGPQSGETQVEIETAVAEA